MKTFDNYGERFTRFDTGDTVRVTSGDLSWIATVEHRNDRIGGGFTPYYMVTGGAGKWYPHTAIAVA